MKDNKRNPATHLAKNRAKIDLISWKMGLLQGGMKGTERAK